jgi:hypothetical protein
VLISNKFYISHYPILAPSNKGPGEIIDINDIKVKIGNKTKVLNVNKLKLFLQESETVKQTLQCKN